MLRAPVWIAVTAVTGFERRREARSGVMDFSLSKEGCKQQYDMNISGNRLCAIPLMLCGTPGSSISSCLLDEQSSIATYAVCSPAN
jgi:hypothetical protein